MFFQKRVSLGIGCSKQEIIDYLLLLMKDDLEGWDVVKCARANTFRYRPGRFEIICRSWEDLDVRTYENDGSSILFYEFVGKDCRVLSNALDLLYNGIILRILKDRAGHS